MKSQTTTKPSNTAEIMVEDGELLEPADLDGDLEATAASVASNIEEADIVDVDVIDVDDIDDIDDDTAEDVDYLELESNVEDELDTDLDAGSKSPEVIVPPASKSAANAGNRTAVKKTSTGNSLEPVSALSAYMSQLANHAPITREEEHALAVRWKEEGDVDAARLMVLSNLRLVVKIAMEYRRAWTNTLDLIQEGNVGLMEAVQRYDPYQGVKLSSYAVYWVRAYILKYILDNLRSVRLGTTRAGRKLFFQLNKEKRTLELEGYEVTPKLLAERLDVQEEDVVAMETQLSRPDLSMDAPRFEGDGRETFGDSFSGSEIGAEDEIARTQMQTVFREAIATFSESLSERDLQILGERILADEPRTLADMGEEFSVSRERVRQLEARIINSLREFMKDRLVDFELYATDSDG
ncbi:MAG: RNA polymerase sigma-32 factor [Myxococcota bacterium]|jgi:RNA polymerase sigma-32 factor